MNVMHSKNYYTILIFDSGIGGLYIYNKIRKLSKNIHFLYILDNAYIPYGEKSDFFILHRVMNVIKTINKIYTKIDLVIIACITASVVVLPILGHFFSFPIVGVLPNLKLACKLTKNKIIGIIATKGTIIRLCSIIAICNYLKGYRILKIGTTKLVFLIEEKLRGQIIHLNKIRNVIHSWALKEESPDTIVLGCTHFSFIKAELKSIFHNKIQLVDSSIEIVDYVTKLFSIRKRYLNTYNNNNYAFCSKYDKNSKLLTPTLKKYGFSIFKEINI